MGQFEHAYMNYERYQLQTDVRTDPNNRKVIKKIVYGFRCVDVNIQNEFS